MKEAENHHENSNNGLRQDSLMKAKINGWNLKEKKIFCIGLNHLPLIMY